MEQWYIKTDIPYQKEFPALIADSKPDMDGYWYIKTDIPYLKTCAPLVAINQKADHVGFWHIDKDIPFQPVTAELYELGDPPPLDPWYINKDIPYQKEFEALEGVTVYPKHTNQWTMRTDIPYQPACAELIPIETHPPYPLQWRMLTDIPYQLYFPPLMSPIVEPSDGDWYINTDIPYNKETAALYNVSERAQHGLQWYILEDIPYQEPFPTMYAIDAEPDDGDWYINTDIPYSKSFPELLHIDDYPLHGKQWKILTDIPYQESCAELIAIDAEPDDGDWYILEDIPYCKEFAELCHIDDYPLHGKQWKILTDIPYQESWAEMIPIDVEPSDGVWYILEDIPYSKDFAELCHIDDYPRHGKQWKILTDIPYQESWAEMIPIDDEPTSGPWYILEDIPYRLKFPELIPIDGHPHKDKDWYILEDIPYHKEFPELIPIDAIPRKRQWYILTDIPYLKEYPPLYPLEPIPDPSEKKFITVGVAAIGRWQIRQSMFSTPDDWTLLEDIGSISDIKMAYVEADGDFDYKAGNESITLTTTENPWMAVIRASDKHLYVKKVGADVETAILLDTDVEQASLCRGWKSDKYSVDSGLICAYRKQNGVFAKVYKKINGEYAWETLPQLLEGHVDHVEVKRMNDYRIGVYVTNPNRLLLSERFYIGGTSKTEYISVHLKPWANVCSFSMVGEPAEKTFKVERCYMEDETKVRMHCNYPIVSFDGTYPNLTLTDDYNYSKLVEYYVQNGDLICILDKPKYSSYNTIRIVIPEINHILYQITPQFKRTIPGGQYAVENPPITEYINTTIVLSATTLHMTERMDYSVKSDDHIATTVRVSSTTLSTTEVHNYVNDTTSDIIQTMLVVSGTTLTMTQSGDLPI